MAKFNIVDKKEDDIKKMLLSCEVEPNEETLIIPNDVEMLHPDCFKGLKHIKKLVLSEAIKGLNEFWVDDDGYTRDHSVSLKDLESLEYIDIKNIVRIPSGPFFDCKKLKVIKSNKKIRVEKYSLLHCFSLKEIDCDKKDIELALGDTDLFNYPLMNKNLDVARLKVDYDYTNIKNQGDFIDNWGDIFESRIKREIITFENETRPILTICDHGRNRDSLEDYCFVCWSLSGKILDLGPFEICESYLPYFTPSNAKLDDFINNLENEFDIELKDIDSPRGKIASIEDAIYFLKLGYLESELSDDIEKAVYEAKTNEEKERIIEGVIEKTKEYLLIEEDYYKEKDEPNIVLLLNDCLSTSSGWKEKLMKNAEWFSSLLGADYIYDLTNVNLSDDVYYAIINEAELFLFNALANKMGHPIEDLKKYGNCLVDKYIVCDYYSISLTGDINHVYCTEFESVGPNPGDLINDICYMIDNEIDEEIRTNYATVIYLSRLLNHDEKGIKAFEENQYDGGYLCANGAFKNYFLFKNDDKSSTKRSSYLWYTCGLRPSNFDCWKPLLDFDYFREIVPDGQYSTVFVAYDIENIILDHDFESFKLIYGLTTHMKSEDWYQDFNFYFNTKAIVETDSGVDEINILEEEGFNTIYSVDDQVID